MGKSLSNWKEVALGEICEFKYGKSLPEAKRAGGGIPVYGSNGVVGYHDAALTDGMTIVIGRKGSFGEVNLSKTSCWSIDTTYYIDHTATEADLRWLSYQLVALKLTELNKSAAVPGLNREDAYRKKLLLPPIAEQKRIAAILDKAEELRGLRRQALRELDAIVQSIFLEMFGNPIQNTKNWTLEQLKSVARVERGKFTPRPRNDPSYYNGKFPFIQTGDISNSLGRLTSWSQTLNEKGIAVSRSFPPKTVVIAIVGATIGVTAILDVEVYCPDSVVGIQPDSNKASAEYIERVLRFWKPIFVAQAPETARANINLETLRPLEIPVPAIELQQEFARRVEAIEHLKTTHRESLAQLDALFASLQHRAFRGEL